jgi:hypothetical protein
MVSEVQGFVERLHPTVQETIRQSFLLTFGEMLKSHRDGRVELEEAVALHTDFASW